jgi:hypothetical protein
MAKKPLPFYTVLGSKYRDRMRTLVKIKKLALILRTKDFWAFRQFPEGLLCSVFLSFPFPEEYMTNTLSYSNLIFTDAVPSTELTLSELKWAGRLKNLRFE